MNQLNETYIKKWLSSTSRGQPIILGGLRCLTSSQVFTQSSYLNNWSSQPPPSPSGRACTLLSLFLVYLQHTFSSANNNPTIYQFNVLFLYLHNEITPSIRIAKPKSLFRLSHTKLNS